MCEYASLNDGKCNVTKDVCPYLYYCSKSDSYKKLRTMPDNCRVKEQLVIPNGFYKISFERRGQLYIDVNGYIEIVPNPYDHVPLYVKMIKLKSGKWKIKQAMG